MSGARRANWDAKLDAVVDAHRSEVAAMLDDEACIRRQADHDIRSDLRAELASQVRRIDLLERRERTLRYMVYGFVIGMVIRTAWAVFHG